MLHELGSRAAYVVHGHGGLDELTTTGPNQVSYFGLGAADEDVVTETLDPQALGFAPRAARGSARRHARGERAHHARRALGPGPRPTARRRAAQRRRRARWSAARRRIWQQGIARAAESIDSGAALGKLEALIAFSQREPSETA